MKKPEAKRKKRTVPNLTIDDVKTRGEQVAKSCGLKFVGNLRVERGNVLKIFESKSKKIIANIQDVSGKITGEPDRVNLVASSSPSKVIASLDTFEKGCKIGDHEDSFNITCKNLGGTPDKWYQCSFFGENGKTTSAITRMDVVLEPMSKDEIPYLRNIYAYVYNPRIGHDGSYDVIETDEKTMKQWINQKDMRNRGFDLETGKARIERGLVKGKAMLSDVIDAEKIQILTLWNTNWFPETKGDTLKNKVRDDLIDNALDMIESLPSKKHKKILNDFTYELARNREDLDYYHLDLDQWKGQYIPDTGIDDAKINLEEAENFLKEYDDPEIHPHMADNWGESQETMDKAAKKARKTVKESKNILEMKGEFEELGLE